MLLSNDQIAKEMDMATKLSLIDYIKEMFRNLNNDHDLGQRGPRHYEVGTITPSLPMELQNHDLSRTQTLKSGAAVAAPLAVSRARRCWSANQEGNWYVEHTRSNLG